MRWTGLIVLLEFSPHATDFLALGLAGVAGAAAAAVLATGTGSVARWTGND